MARKKKSKKVGKRFSTGSLRILQTDIVGAISAEEDRFLEDCYVDIGWLDVLADPSDQRCIVIGRTGAGKTAILKRLEDTNENVIWMDPIDLAIEHIHKSQILNAL